MKTLLYTILLYFTLFLSLCVAQEPSSCEYFKNETDLFCQSKDYPTSYLEGTCICVFEVVEGLQIDVNVDDLDLDSSEGDKLLLNTGTFDKEYQFTWFLNETTNSSRKFLINKSKVTVTFIAKQNQSDHRGFSMHLQQYGELTTTEQPTTEIIIPTPSANDSIYYTIYLNAIPLEFEDKIDDLKSFMLNITKKYCKKYLFPVTEEITIKNIQIQVAQQCSIQWPDSENCVEVTYAIPVSLNITEYEFSTKNLEKMWNKFGVKEINDALGLNVYKPPDNDYNMMLWLILSLIVLILFFGFLFFIRIIGIRINSRLKRRLSDTQQIITNSNHASDASLWPMSSQIVPPLFESNEIRYVYYEPDSNLHTVANSQSNAKPMMNVDDLSDEEILTVTNNTATGLNQTVLKFTPNNSRESIL